MYKHFILCILLNMLLKICGFNFERRLSIYGIYLLGVLLFKTYLLTYIIYNIENGKFKI